MNVAKLGACQEEYEPNAAEWGRSILALGSMIVMGVLGFSLTCYRSIQAGSLDWLLLSVSSCLVGIAAYLLYQIRPRLLSLAVHEHGLFINERENDTRIRWEDVAKIEHTVHRFRSRDVAQLLIETRGDTHLLVNSLTISKFDDFLAKMQQQASEHGLEWVDDSAPSLGAESTFGEQSDRHGAADSPFSNG